MGQEARERHVLVEGLPVLAGAEGVVEGSRLVAAEGAVAAGRLSPRRHRAGPPSVLAPAPFPVYADRATLCLDRPPAPGTRMAARWRPRMAATEP